MIETPIKQKKRIDPTVLRISLILAFGVLAPIFDSTMVNIAIPTMSKDMHTSIAIMQWAITGYTLTMGIAVPFGGWATDRFNGKSVYSSALLMFLIGSLFAAMSTTVPSLIIGRLIQGAAAGLLMQALSTLVMRAANGKNIGTLMATIGIPIMIGPVIGPVLGAFIVNHANWHMMFWVNIPITIVSLLFVFFGVPDLPAIHPKLKIDYIGIGLLGGFFTGIILGISHYSSDIDFLAQTNMLFELGVSLLAIILYIIYAKVKPNKVIVPLTIFKYRNLTVATILMMLAGITTNGPLMLLPLYFQNIRGESIMNIGLIMGAQAIGMLVMRSQGGKLTDIIGPKWVTITGLLITLLATLPFIWVDVSTSTWWLVTILFVRGLGMGIMMVPVMSAAYIGVPKQRMGQATVTTDILQSVGGAAGSAILASIVVNVAITSPKSTSLLTMTHAYNTGFSWAAGFTLLMFLPAWFLSSKKAVN
ncbi:DHA2 family efflux MFS transporter permease subunit [Sporosarcina sp. BI001-red]|uniref:DHA2 family efflux MFS transporter permease subunit n=1 Tax=Sporosarcina sp. BI001-red TaxID=2282866 RepID=UPI001314274A|nr:DHA2 family efflux MFS transporter permease subunit [Sporosarcina sp. BI001-red]